MCPRYPAVARATQRLRTTVESARGLNGADAAWNGPSRTTRPNKIAETKAQAAAARMIVRHFSTGATARRRFGIADPIVSAPTKMPMAVPRPARHHPAAILIPGGYTPAKAAPVTPQRTIAVATPVWRQVSAAVAMLTKKADPEASRRALKRSLRRRTALTNVPSTNPSWTAIVSQAPTLGVAFHSAIIPGAATVALNQGVIPRTIPRASTASCREAPGARSGFVKRRPTWLDLRRQRHARPREQSRCTPRASDQKFQAAHQDLLSGAQSRHLSSMLPPV